MDKRNEPLLSLKKIYKTYGGVVETEVLKDLSLDINAGEFMSIIGPSGSGKSTLLNILGALDQPTKGDIIFNNKNIAEMNDDQLADFRNQNLGFVFQFHHLLPEFTALENVLMPHWIKVGAADKNIRQRAEKLIYTVGLYEQKDKKATQLSGGQKQRIAIARSLMNKPAILLADEPTGNLDTESSEQVFELMRKINKEQKTVFIIVTHDRHLAGRTQRIIELIDGEIVHDIVGTDNREEDIWDKLAPSYCLKKENC